MIKVKSCQKSSQILDVFALSNSWGQPFQNLYPCYHTRFEPRRLVKFCEVTPTNYKVIGVHVKFEAQFQMFALKNFGGPRLGLGLQCALANFDQTLACVKISGASTPKGQNIVSRKSQLGCVQTHVLLSR